MWSKKWRSTIKTFRKKNVSLNIFYIVTQNHSGREDVKKFYRGKKKMFTEWRDVFTIIKWSFAIRVYGYVYAIVIGCWLVCGWLFVRMLWVGEPLDWVHDSRSFIRGITTPTISVKKTSFKINFVSIRYFIFIN